MPRVRPYCIDGSNLVRGSSPSFQEETDTRWLVEACGELCRRLDGGFELELFFDGAARPEGASTGPDNLRVRFTHEETADDMILDRVRAGKYKGAVVTVVTGDGELGRKVAEEGGRWQKVARGVPLEAVIGSIERRLCR